MKITNGDGPAVKAGASNHRRLSLSGSHADHVTLLDSLTASLKEELRRGLNLLDSCVSQMAQAKWVILNVDKTIEEFYADCPACNINNNRKKTNGIVGCNSGGVGSSSNNGRQNNKLKVFPMISGHTVQRPKINVTRIEQQRKDNNSRPKPSVAASATVAPTDSCPTPGTSTGGLTIPQPIPNGTQKIPRKNSKSRKRPRPPRVRRRPAKKSSVTVAQPASALAQDLAPTETSTAIPSTSQAKSQATGPGSLGDTNMKKQGSKCKSNNSSPPLLSREAADDDVVEILQNEDSKLRSSPRGLSSVNKQPILIPCSPDKELRVTSISLKRRNGNGGGASWSATIGGRLSDSDQITKATSQDFAETRPTGTDNYCADPNSSVRPGSGAARRKLDDGNPAVGSPPSADKKPKLTSPQEEEKDNKAILEAQLQLKYQKYREQQRKRELMKKTVSNPTQPKEEFEIIHQSPGDTASTSEMAHTSITKTENPEPKELPKEQKPCSSQELKDTAVENDDSKCTSTLFHEMDEFLTYSSALPVYSPEELKEVGVKIEDLAQSGGDAD